MMENLSAGFRIGEYILKEKIGEGGFGEVWKGEHHFLKGKWGAIKILKPDFSPEILEGEAQIQFELQKILEQDKREQGMVKIIGCDPTFEPAYLISEYIKPDSQGRTSLRDHLKHAKNTQHAQSAKNQGGLDSKLALNFFREMVHALSSAHSKGLIHGDLKPENILIEDGRTAKLADFGLGKALPLDGENLSRSLKVSGEQAILGTLAYMSPEQKKGKRPDASSDMYALGMLLYEMVVGELPQGGELPSQVVSDLPPEIDHIFKKCYNHRDFRYQNAEELQREWEALERDKARETTLQCVQQPTPSALVEAGLLQGETVDDAPDFPYGKPAGFGIRSLAFGVDILTLALAFSALLPTFSRDLERGSLLFSAFVLSSLYWIFTTCILGGTLGKLALGIKVVGPRGEKLDLGASFSRWIGYFFSIFFFGFGFYMVVFHPEKRGLHDFFGSSRVVYDREKTRP